MARKGGKMTNPTSERLKMILSANIYGRNPNKSIIDHYQSCLDSILEWHKDELAEVLREIEEAALSTDKCWDKIFEIREREGIV